jgi:hypothetical protein
VHSYLHRDIRQACRVSVALKQDAGQGELQFNLFDLTPQLQSAVRLDGNV